MSVRVIALAVAVASVLGCSTKSDNAITVYTGKVTKIESSDARHYFIDVGLQPVTYVWLSEVTSGSGSPTHLRIGFAGLVDRGALGSVGDRVRFQYRGRLPFDGEIWATDLQRYSVATATRR